MAKKFGRKNMYLNPMTGKWSEIPEGWERDDSPDGLGKIGSKVDDPESEVTEEKTITKDAKGNETTVIRKNAENNPTFRFNKFKEQQEQSGAQTSAPATSGKPMGFAQAAQNKEAANIASPFDANEFGAPMQFAAAAQQREADIKAGGGTLGANAFGDMFTSPGKPMGFEQAAVQEQLAREAGMPTGGGTTGANAFGDMFTSGGKPMDFRRAAVEEQLAREAEMLAGGGTTGANFSGDAFTSSGKPMDFRRAAVEEQLQREADIASGGGTTGANAFGDMFTSPGKPMDFRQAAIAEQLQREAGMPTGGGTTGANAFGDMFTSGGKPMDFRQAAVQEQLAREADIASGGGTTGANASGDMFTSGGKPMDFKQAAESHSFDPLEFSSPMAFAEAADLQREANIAAGGGTTGSNFDGDSFTSQGKPMTWPTPEELQQEEMANAQTAARKQGIAPIGRVPDESVLTMPENKVGFAEAAALKAASGQGFIDDLNFDGRQPGNFSGFEAPAVVDNTYGDGNMTGRGNVVEEDGARLANDPATLAAASARDAAIEERRISWQGRPAGGDDLLTSRDGGDTPIESRFDQFGGVTTGASGIQSPHPQSKGPEGSALWKEHDATQKSDRNLAKLADVEKRLAEIQTSQGSGTLASTKLGAEESRLLKEQEELKAKQEGLDTKLTAAQAVASEFDVSTNLGTTVSGGDEIESDDDIVGSDDGEETETQKIRTEIEGASSRRSKLTGPEATEALLNNDNVLNADVQTEAVNIINQSPKCQMAMDQMASQLSTQDLADPEKAVKKAGGFLDGLFGGDDPMMQQAIMSMLIGWLSTGSISQGAAMGLQSYQNQIMGAQELEQTKAADAAKLQADNKKERLSLKKAGYTNASIEAYQATGNFNALKDSVKKSDPVQLKKDGYSNASIRKYLNTGDFTDLKQDTAESNKSRRTEVAKYVKDGYTKASVEAFMQTGNAESLVFSDRQLKDDLAKIAYREGLTNLKADTKAKKEAGVDFLKISDATSTRLGKHWTDEEREDYNIPDMTNQVRLGTMHWLDKMNIPYEEYNNDAEMQTQVGASLDTWNEFNRAQVNAGKQPNTNPLPFIEADIQRQWALGSGLPLDVFTGADGKVNGEQMQIARKMASSMARSNDTGSDVNSADIFSAWHDEFSKENDDEFKKQAALAGMAPFLFWIEINA